MIEPALPTMTCGHCVKAVTATVQEVDAAATLQIDLPTHRVRIESVRSAEEFKSALTRCSLFWGEPLAYLACRGRQPDLTRPVHPPTIQELVDGGWGSPGAWLSERPMREVIALRLLPHHSWLNGAGIVRTRAHSRAISCLGRTGRSVMCTSAGASTTKRTASAIDSGRM